LTLSGAGEMVLLLDSNRLTEFYQRFHSHLGEVHRNEEGRPAAAKSGRRVLIVDDSLSARKMLVKKMTQHGFQATESGDGFDALEKLRHDKFDLVLTDLDMPRLGGIEMLFDMQRGQFGDAPVVVVTSRNEEEIRLRALENGAVDFLNKPVSDAALVGMLNRLKLLQTET
jgi:CheY-like chemotaxis protein